MKILISPDKFKGSLTALEVSTAIEKGIKKVIPTAEIIKLPLADGGEGSLEALEKTIKFERKFISVNNPLFFTIHTWYGLKDNIAYIEMAKASGLQLLSEEERNPLLTTSIGTGELIADAITNGAKKIFLFIGGSATNDAAIGIASALGYKFYDVDKHELKPIGKSLNKIRSFEYSQTVSLDNINIDVLTDVQNPFVGENGAAYVYAKQKGADDKSVEELEAGMINILRLFKSDFNIDVSRTSGSGAAGGIGGGMVAFCKADLQSGIDVIFNLLNFDKVLELCDFVLTGEGKLDKQTLEGKVVGGVIDKAISFNRKVGIVCGELDSEVINREILNNIIIKMIKSKEITTQYAIQNAAQLLEERSEELMKIYLEHQL